MEWVSLWVDERQKWMLLLASMLIITYQPTGAYIRRLSCQTISRYSMFWAASYKDSSCMWSEKHQKLRVSQFHLQWNRGDVTTGFTLYRAAWHSLSKGWSLGLGACMVWSPCREFLIETVCIVNVLYSKQIVWWRRKEAVNDSFRVGALLQLPCPYLQKLKKHLILQPGYIS